MTDQIEEAAQRLFRLHGFIRDDDGLLSVFETESNLNASSLTSEDLREFSGEECHR